MHAVSFLLALAASAAAYKVTSPAEDDIWKTGSDNTLKWDMVSSDRGNFSVFLTNQDRSILPENNVVLNDYVEGSAGSVVVTAPQGGWPSGKGFRLNLCQDKDHPESILAQSEEFELEKSASSSTSAGSSSTTARTSATGTGSQSQDASATGSSSDSAASASTTPDGAMSITLTHTGIFAALAAVVAMLA
ncbi:hypothetical protein CYLTODRAFT_416471 [Cylindrobasidium torrendii FP15055 ss-10]|uniref:Yeast cell wall synthesis Kre9/Knh1-like N-terminal domain-containing protein n=1 Tax=Cylindrobasidium torrendii FP15055 ss-10 TaxID=1314674 RepID=A0A0D7BVG8_9AGAR|nr:hypothetical protein CYLTODRAFT_416471 [Cylindrobasidium torrendii FP15055 ss-10]